MHIGGLTKTFMLMTGMTAIFGGVGFMLGGAIGALIALSFAIVMNGLAYWNSDKMLLRHYNAEPVDEKNAPDLYGIIRQLVQNAGLTMPKIYIIQDPQPNAFATGRNPENAAVAITTGLLERLSQNEVAGVMAHELAHVKNRDMLIMTMSASFAGAISTLANFALWFRPSGQRGGIVTALAVMILAPIAAALIQMTISRTREYEADRLGAEICSRPEWLASALEKISTGVQQYPRRDVERDEATAHMFIANPFGALKGMQNWFSTHPPIEERVNRLRHMRLS